MECATDAQSLNRALKKHARAELVLVDTSGSSPRDIAGIQETCDTLRGASEPLDVYMCVTAAMREAELIVEEARSEGRSIVRQAAADNERLESDSARIRALLRAALATIDSSGEDEEDDDEERPEAA